MSFLGLSKELATPVLKSGNAHHFPHPLIDLYYEKDTNLIETEEYQLLLIGQALLAPEQGDIRKALQDAKGTFCFVLLFKNEIFVGTDSMGFYPLYYTPGKHFNFANTITHLKHRIPNLTINWDSWDELLNGSNDILGEKTVISEISRLGPGQTLHYQNNTLNVINKEFYFPSPVTKDVNGYMEENNRILSDFMVESFEHNKNKCVIPLTSGHDSRRLAVTATANKLNYQAITQQTREISGYDKDTFVSKKLSELLAVPIHTTLNMPPEDVIQYHKAYRDYWTGFESAEHEWSINMVDSIPSQSLIFDGLIGDVTINSSNHMDDPSLIGIMHDTEKLVNEMYKSPKCYSLKKSLLNSERHETIREELMRFPSGINQLYLFRIFNRGRRNIGCWFHPFLQKGHSVSLPYVNPEFLSQSLSLDEGARFKVWYQLECLKKINPEAANLPSSRDKKSNSFWQQAGATKTTTDAQSFSPKQVPLNGIWPNLDFCLKEFILDQLGSAICPDRIIASRGWRLRPLQRLALFMSWMDTDESELPILFDGEPPFLDKFKPR